MQTRSGKVGDPGEDVEPEPTTRLNTPAEMPERMMISSSSAPEANALTFNPTERNKLLSDPRVSGSSSITNTIGPSESGMQARPLSYASSRFTTHGAHRPHFARVVRSPVLANYQRDLRSGVLQGDDVCVETFVAALPNTVQRTMILRRNSQSTRGRRHPGWLTLERLTSLERLNQVYARPLIFRSCEHPIQMNTLKG